MYTFSKSLKNMYRFQIQDSNLFFISKESNRLYFEEKNLLDDVKSFIIHSHFLIIRNSKMEILKYNLFSNQIKLLLSDYSFGEKIFINDLIIVNKWEDEKLTEKFIFNIEEEKKVIDIKDNPNQIINSGFLYTESNKIIIKNWNDETLWQYSVKEIGKYQEIGEKEGEIRKIIGVFDGVLVVNISGGNTQYDGQVIGIDAENGKLLWQIQNLNQRQIYHLRVNDAQTHLYALKDQEYLEISLGTAQITKQKNLGEVLKYNGNAIKVIDITSKGEHLFFTAMYEGKTFSSGLLGAFNTQTEKLDWIHDMEFGANCFFTASSAPTVEGNRLYALDKAGTLHIFEREV